MTLRILVLAGGMGALFSQPNVLAQGGETAQIEEVVVVGSRFQTSRSEASP